MFPFAATRHMTDHTNTQPKKCAQYTLNSRGHILRFCNLQTNANEISGDVQWQMRITLTYRRHFSMFCSDIVMSYHTRCVYFFGMSIYRWLGANLW